MSRLADRLNYIKDSGKKGLIIYITGGCPDLDTTVQAVLAAEKAGADVVEIGIPFSDPMADGPVIQKAAAQALQAGVTVSGILETVRKIRTQSNIPLALMTYFNPILQFGTDAFVQTARQAGVDGLIVPDVPFEENQELFAPCQKLGVNLVQFVAPTTTIQRLANTCRAANGFIYCISNTGVTGIRDVDFSGLEPIITEVKSRTPVPVAIGFGIASPEAAARAAQYADAVIVGSAVVDRLMTDGIDGAAALIAGIRKALDGEIAS
ncbi:hypothetical protein P22_3110 [Propionispora sp. 2/2-37]|uniref:tryptophan synthase subunit alpha n=1 Tax=Propionispora sp. 2/2-37 TaxID=1677858 RepID=UPI0006BF687C|nr:tryptophan synthase subunit alpha [Propionispora sp. 2/2-37]CUH96984.1 hypothetical protein P22_3110 [Propionispora sp. 2/2-37]